jgi:D-alanyl-D-alanine carboxypeptidase/D-alanyl-D-alanine-endopeptidase (penicillin-binding protein 4)
VDDPASFARSAFIQSLERAGVSVDAPATGDNPRALPRSHPASTCVAQHVSPEFNQHATVVLGSAITAALTSWCLSAPKSGSRNCPDGLSATTACWASWAC